MQVGIHKRYSRLTPAPLSPLLLGRRSFAATLFDRKGTLVSRWRLREWRLVRGLVDVRWSLSFLSESVKGSLTLSSVLPSSLGLPKVHTYELAINS